MDGARDTGKSDDMGLISYGLPRFTETYLFASDGLISETC